MGSKSTFLTIDWKSLYLNRRLLTIRFQDRLCHSASLSQSLVSTPSTSLLYYLSSKFSLTVFDFLSCPALTFCFSLAVPPSHNLPCASRLESILLYIRRQVWRHPAALKNIRAHPLASLDTTLTSKSQFPRLHHQNDAEETSKEPTSQGNK